MGIWDSYQGRMTARGDSTRNASLIREMRFIDRKLPNNLSYTGVDIYPQEVGFNIDTDNADGKIIQDVAIINSDNLNEKHVISMPGEDVSLGSLLHWMNEYWLVTERDANTTLYTKCKIIQCNHLLKWITDDHEVIEQWCIFDDGTKLKRMRIRNSLAYRKRCVKRIPLIAGNS